MIHAVFCGALAQVPFDPDPMFGVLVPRSCADVPSELLRPRTTWVNAGHYDASARRLAALFHANFKKYAGQVSEAVRAAGPRS